MGIPTNKAHAFLLSRGLRHKDDIVTAFEMEQLLNDYATEQVNDYKCNVMERGEHIYLKIDINQPKYEKLISELLQQDGWMVAYSCRLRENPKYIHTKLIRE